jgi:phage terminase small subunit
MPATPALTTKQARFIDEYLVDGNGAGAAVRAGYSPSGAHVTASRMLRKATPVARAVEARQAADATRLSIQRVDVLTGLLEAAETARERGEPAAMISAWATIARLQGYFAADRLKVDVTVDMGEQFDRMNRLSDRELMAIVEKQGRV